MLLAWLLATSMLTACGSPVFDRSLKLIDLGFFFLFTRCQKIMEKCRSVSSEAQDDFFKCLVLSTT